MMPKKKSMSSSVSKKRMTELLSDPHWVRDEELEKRFDSQLARMFRHPNGQLLVVTNQGNGRLHFSRDQFLNVLNSMPKQPQSILNSRIPQGKEFPDQVASLILQLSALLNIPSNQLDMSDESLDKLLSKMRRKGYAICLEPPIFPALVAYLGEIMRIRLNGEWRMRFSEDGETWEPWIVAHNHAYNPWLDLYTDLEEGKGISLRSIVTMRIAHPRPNPPGLGIPTPTPTASETASVTLTLKRKDPSSEA
ncbi:MAG: hypothetical protein U0670_19015 [Anaerolineae bacterium]